MNLNPEKVPTKYPFQLIILIAVDILEVTIDLLADFLDNA
jgi:hypothetical protein